MKKDPILLSKRDNWVRPFFKKYKKLLALVLFLGFLTFFTASALMFASGYLISKSATMPENILMVYVPIVLTRAFGILRPTFRYVERLGSHNWVLKMTSDIRVRLYRSLESKAAQTKEMYQSGSILGLLAEDIDHIQNLYLRTIFPACVALILYIFVIIGLGWFSLPFAAMMLLLMGVLLFVLPLTAVLVNQAKTYRKKEQKHVLYDDLTDAVLGIADWQYSGRYHDFLTDYNKSETLVRKEEASMRSYTRWEGILRQALLGIIAVSLFVWAGNYFGQFGDQESLNWIAAFVLAFFPLIDAFVPVSDSVKELPIYEDTVERLSKLPEPDKDTDTKESRIAVPKEVKVEFNQVTFHYPGSKKKILNQFDLEINPSEVLAILGKSGTGKTTLTQLLRGDLTPNKGEVLVNGVATAELYSEQAKYFSVLNQQPYLFNTTLKNNIQLGNLEANDDDILRAIDQVGLSEVVEKLPNGLDTLVEENGKRFSGGEQQRIALARILLQDTPIVIIDEPTIGLDPLTEKRLLNTIFKVLEGKTVIWITHHLTGIAHANRVIFLEDGTTEMSGAPKELLATNQRFKELYDLDTYE